MPPASTTGADASNGNAPKSREHNQGNQDRSYTVEQKQAVLRIRRCSPTAFYDILGIEEVKTTVTETEIKKAYRKQSLLTHPDKNGHEHADEAFKMVSRAFGVLGDAEKRAKYDRYGGDPDSRFGGGAPSQSPFGGFGGRSPAGGAARAGPGWDDDISPEEMFNRFFGGGGGMGGGFGTFGTFGSGSGSAFRFGSSFGFSSDFDSEFDSVFVTRPRPGFGAGLDNSFRPGSASIFQSRDAWFTQARREHDDMMRRFFH